MEPRFRVAVVACLVTLVTASGSFGGTTYRFRAIYDGPSPRDVSGRVWVEDGQARREYDPGGPSPFNEGRVEIARAGDAEILVLDLKERTFHATRNVETSPLGTLRLPSPFEGPYSVKDLAATLEEGAQDSGSPGPDVVRHVVLALEYTLSQAGSQRAPAAHIAVRAEFWVSDRYAGTRLGFGDGDVGLRSGIAEVDGAVSAKLNDVHGVAVKTAVTATRMMERGNDETESLTWRITEIRATTVEAARFERPAGFVHKEPASAETLQVITEPVAEQEDTPLPRSPVSASNQGFRLGEGGPPGLTEALVLLRAGRTDEALEKLKTLEKASGGKCPLCVLGLAMAYNRLGAYKDAAAAARRFVEDGSAGDEVLARAYNELGIALVASKDKKRFADAEQALRKAIALDGRLDAAYQNLVGTLFKLERADEARKVLTDLEKQTTNEETRRWAARTLENPRCAESHCPAGVTFVTADGETVDLESLRGKVVLVTFWASWCAPCVEAIPDLKYIQKRFEKDLFAIVGVNVDDDRDAMTRLVTASKISWPQCWDGEGRITRDMFGIHSFPTDVVLDHEGVELGRTRGWGTGSADRLSRAILDALGPARKAHKRATEDKATAAVH